MFHFTSQIEPIQNLLNYCENAYIYFYFQLRHDILSKQLPNIDYKSQRNEILGFCSVDMYREILEKKHTGEELKREINDLMKNYKKFVPKYLTKSWFYSIMLQVKVNDFLQTTTTKNYNV